MTPFYVMSWTHAHTLWPATCLYGEETIQPGRRRGNANHFEAVEPPPSNPRRASVPFRRGLECVPEAGSLTDSHRYTQTCPRPT